MIHPWILWRLEVPAEACVLDRDAWQAAVRLHLRYSAVAAMTLRVRGREQAYVTLEGCEGCLRQACRPGCRSALFRRVLTRSLPGSDLGLVAAPQGLATRPTERVVVLWPGRTARPFELTRWDEARLIVSWTGSRQVRVGALLAVEDDGPDPAEVARAAGWLVLPGSGLFGPRLARQPKPTPRRWLGARWPGAVPLLLTPWVGGQPGSALAGDADLAASPQVWE
ncbi:hypothetical protein [Candidatus Chloroploca asiatica]|uniref:Uncharacterized protein n=1 Tax=Candidatus Chloroploca asiatica TaxID=1506545 RepID=A0A2H3KVT8_9CHLR|nr:hypothetical protein [Candidatus Chloroploca asiatica]PDV98002.1 hypothetical protein A9Q02_16550 [Candidatus Chloroploca asiatica]